jgi:hypothetical protein
VFLCLNLLLLLLLLRPRVLLGQPSQVLLVVLQVRQVLLHSMHLKLFHLRHSFHHYHLRLPHQLVLEDFAGLAICSLISVRRSKDFLYQYRNRH